MDTKERKKLLAAYRWFRTKEGQLVLDDLMEKFGYNEPEFEDHDNILSVKPHERRGMKQPIKHIMRMMHSILTQPERDNTTYESSKKIKPKTLHAPEESGDESSQEDRS